MTEEKAFGSFPKTHISPYDGMSITADIWQDAHEEHRQTMRAHDLVFHGTGVVYGLEVVANDPADQMVFISPGVAVDSAGNVVVLQEPVAYEFGDDSQGELYIVIGHGQREIGGVDNEARYMQDEFVVAALPEMPKRPAVEIARIWINKAGSPVKNAADPVHPNAGELDLRYRSDISPQLNQIVSVGLVNLGGKVEGDVLAGWNQLGKMSARDASLSLAVDQHAEVVQNASKYDLLCLSGKGSCKLSAGDQKAIKDFIKDGKKILVEALDEKAAESCQQILKDLGAKVSAVKGGDELLESVYLFSQAPEGVMVGKDVIYSEAGFSPSWAGKSAAGGLSRSDIRTAQEWGVNMLAHCLK